MNLWKRMGAAVLAGTLALSLVACGGGNTSSAGSTADGSSTAGGGTTGSKVLNVMIEVEVASLDPQLATDGTSFEVIANFTDGLTQMDARGRLHLHLPHP